MSRLSFWVSVACVATAVHANPLQAEPQLSAAQIVEKNVAARGGLEAWRKIQSMVWLGHIERASANAPNLPYVLEQKRPNKTHFEIMAKSQVGTRVFDGVQGWKVHPGSNGVPALEPYTADELSFARDGQGIDGDLMDYQAKGITIALEGMDEVEGQKAYRLSLKRTSGATHRVWIDAQSFLEMKYERPLRHSVSAPGKRSSDLLKRPGTVTVFYRNYQAVEGLQIPLLIESGSDVAKATDRMVIDKVVLNPPLADKRFAKPDVPAVGKVLAGEGRPVGPLRPDRAWPTPPSRQVSRVTGTQ